MGSSAYIPLERRTQNKVDKLQLRIRKIQKSCKHDFRRVEKYKPRKSLVRQAYILYDASINEFGQMLDFVFTCTKCSLTNVPGSTDNVIPCPQCLINLIKGPLEPRRKYFGAIYHSYAARIFYCTNCNVRFVVDEKRNKRENHAFKTKAMS